MRIGILLSGRYPTEKAYGVTTNSTVKCLSEMGHAVYVVGLESMYSEDVPIVDKFTVLQFKESKFTKFIKARAFASHGILSQISWWIYWRILRILNKSMLNSLSLDMIWIRDPQMMQFATNVQRIILEIHQNFNFNKLKKRIATGSKSKVIIAPISQSLLKRFKGTQLEDMTIFSPMGINPEDVTDKEAATNSLNLLLSAIRDQSRPLRIGYVGKFYPNGYSKGIEDILGLSMKRSIKNIPIEISLTGGTQSEMDLVIEHISALNLDQTYLHLNSHVPHKHALEAMRNLDVIVLPSPNSDQYMGFPLKCLEAFATGRVVVVARSKIYEDVFNEQFQPYWYTPGDSDSLFNSIEEAISDPELRCRIIEGLDFTKGFTWMNRTGRLMNEFID